MPIHGSVLQLIGWQLTRGGSRIINDERKRLTVMRIGLQELVAETGQDFGFDLAAWQEYLLSNSDAYNHPYAFASVDQVVRDTITDPEYARLAEIAGLDID